MENQKPFSKRLKKAADRMKRRCTAWWYRQFPANLESKEIDILPIVTFQADRFVGLYEPVYQVSRGAVELRDSVFGEWCLRVENLELNNSFSQTFLDLFSEAEGWTKKETIQRAVFLLSCFESAAIQRDPQRSFTAAPDTGDWYSSLDGEDLVPGEQLKVKKPCWKQDGKLLERGLVLRKSAAKG